MITKRYWSRAPGKFVNKMTGEAAVLSSALSAGPLFNGTVREWYETLVETINDANNELKRQVVQEQKTIGKKKYFHNIDKKARVYVSPDIRCILEQSGIYKANIDNWDAKEKVIASIKLPIGEFPLFDVYLIPSMKIPNRILVNRGDEHVAEVYVHHMKWKKWNEEHGTANLDS